MGGRRDASGRTGDETRFLLAVVGALKNSPAYILIFAVIALTYLFCIALAAAGFTDSSGNLLRYGLGGLVFETMLVAGVIVVLEGQGARKSRIVALEQDAARDRARLEQLDRALDQADRSDINIPNEEARKCLAAVVDDVRQALGFPNDTFHSEVFYQLNDFKTRTSSRWAEGTLHTDPGNYDRILRNFYRNAKRSVLATSNDEYMNFWEQPESAEQIMRAHRKAFEANGTRVKRIFVFSNLASVTQNLFDIIKAQAKEEFLTPRIFFADENRNEAFNEQLVSDFVIIDEGLPTQAIGITSSFDPGRMGAKWVFDRDTRVELTGKWIDDGSISVSELGERLRRGDQHIQTE